MAPWCIPRSLLLSAHLTFERGVGSGEWEGVVKRLSESEGLPKAG